MKALSILFMLVAAIGFTPLGCADKPGPVEATAVDEMREVSLGKAEVTTQNIREEWSYYLPASLWPCLGEGIQFSGIYHFVTQTVLDGRGGFHSTWHYNRQNVQGVSDGGTVYHQTGGGTERENFSGVVGEVYTFSEHVNFLGHGGGASNDFMITWQIKYVVNANGEVKIYFDEWTGGCK